MSDICEQLARLLRILGLDFDELHDHRVTDTEHSALARPKRTKGMSAPRK